MTIIDLGQKVKAKYPGQYDDLTDEDVGRKVKAKYPKEYADFSELNYTPKPVAQAPVAEQRNVAADVAIGLGKSGLETVRGASSLGERFLQGTLKTLLPKAAEKRLGLDRQTGAEALIPESAITATNTAQKVGKFGGDVAQFLIPGGGIGRAAKALEGTAAVSKLGKVAPVASRIITEAGVAAGGEAIKSGKVSGDTLKAAGIGAAFPAATGLIGKAAKSVVSTRNAERLVNSLIKPLKSQRTFGKNPGRVIAEEGIVANTLEELGSKVNVRRQQIGKEIKRAIGSKTRPVNASSVLQPIDEAIAKASRNPRINAPVLARLQAVKDDLLGVVDNQPTINLQSIKPTNLFDFKGQVADLTRWTGNPSDDKLVNLALQKTYTKIRKTLENTVGKQKLGKLNQKYADLLGAGDAIKNRVELIERSNINPLTSRLTGLTVGAGTGGVVGGIPGAVVGMAAERIASSPTVKLGTAKMMSQAARKGLPESVKRAGRGIGRAISIQ